MQMWNRNVKGAEKPNLKLLLPINTSTENLQMYKNVSGKQKKFKNKQAFYTY